MKDSICLREVRVWGWKELYAYGDIKVGANTSSVAGESNWAPSSSSGTQKKTVIIFFHTGTYMRRALTALGLLIRWCSDLDRQNLFNVLHPLHKHPASEAPDNDVRQMTRTYPAVLPIGANSTLIVLTSNPRKSITATSRVKGSSLPRPPSSSSSRFVTCTRVTRR